MFYLIAWFYGIILAGVEEPIFIGPFDSEQECQEVRAEEIRRGLQGADTCFWGYKVHGFASVEGRAVTTAVSYAPCPDP